MKKVIIYSTETCVYCDALKDWFNQTNVIYEEKDLSDPIVNEEISKKLGYPVTSVPTILIGDQVIVGFNRAAIKKALSQ